MAEDFDKEAAYVEENEFIGEKFPNMQEVKKEILNYYDNEFESTPYSVQKNRESLLPEEMNSRNFQSPCPVLTNNDNSQNMLLNCNKIILGSKPNRDCSDEENVEKSAKNYQEKNEVSIDENYFEELVASYEPTIVLQDIKSYLHKSKRFCDTCSILFPEANGYENHVEIFHTEKLSTGISLKESLHERRQHKCLICAKQFVALHVLRRHLINIHKFNNSKAKQYTTKETCTVADDTAEESNGEIIGNTTEEDNVAIIENTMEETNANVIENTVEKACATVFNNITNDANAKVIANTFKETSTPKIRHESSDLSNTCFHCKKAFETQKSLIEHLYDILQMKRKNTEIVPVLKSVLFKCNKCDIHFTSSQLAANHAEHMEMLINWKCTICNRIFKKEDELSHERQHSVSNNFLIYNLGDLDVTNILFRCSKCATHFTESNFLYHFRDCGLEVTKTVTCQICNILLDYNLKSLHELDRHTESKSFTIIQCDVISDNPVKPTANKSHTREKLKELLKSFREVKIVLEKIDSNKTCRLTKSGTGTLSSEANSRSISESSSQAMSSNELPRVLQDNQSSGKCWRTRLRTSKNTSRNYKLLHGLNKNRPNIVCRSVLGRRNVTYSYCTTCKCFITKFSKAAHVQGRCKNKSDIACTCEHCGLILNKASFMTHRRLHMERTDIQLKNFRFFNLSTGRSMNPPIPEYPKCTQCAVHFLTERVKNNHVCGEVVYRTCHICKLRLCNVAFKFHMTFHQYATDRIKRGTMKNSHISSRLKIGTYVADKNITSTMKNDTELTRNLLDLDETTPVNRNPANAMKDNTKKDAFPAVHKRTTASIAQHLALRRRNLTYCYCETCKCFVTKFRKASHVQGRCKKLRKLACTCEYCGLILTSSSIVTHRRLHTEKKDLKLKNFRFLNLYTGRSMNPPLPEYPKCTHCAIHFLTKRARRGHVCSKEAYQTCNSCDIRLSEDAFKFHVMFHKYATDRNKIVKTKNLQAETTLDIVKRVNDENVTDTVGNENEFPSNQLDGPETKQTAVKRLRNMGRKYEMRLLNSFQTVNKKRPDFKSRCLTYSYCKTCKCFVTKKKAAHVQGRCKNLGKTACTCEYCGLILTSASIVTHRRLHMEKKGLTLNNFRFFNLHNGRSTNPAIPDYPKCNHCAIHFLTEKARDDHICNAEVHQTCHDCKIKLSERAFKLHMTFHQYATDRIIRVSPKNSHSTLTLDTEKCVADETLTNSKESNIETTHNPLDEAKTKLTVNMHQEYKNDDKTQKDANKTRRSDNEHHLALGRRNMLYSYCETCKCFITKFKKAVHVQGRCKNLAKLACTCEHCGLILNDVSTVTHRRLHEEIKDLNLKHFRFFNLYTGRSMNPPIPEYPKCTQCAVHFLTKKARNNHICSAQSYQACRFCKIKLSQAAFKLHMPFHKYPTDRVDTGTTKNTHSIKSLHKEKPVIGEDVTNSTTSTIETLNNSLDVAETTLTADVSQECKNKTNVEEIKKIPFDTVDHFALTRRNMTYLYCETCKCFVTKFRKASHVQGRCKKLMKTACTCEHCGLVLNDASIVTHRRLHQERKKIKLKNFRFFNLYTGRPMNPPIPEYPKCTQCDVHFLTKKSKSTHICSALSSQQCSICGVKLSQAAFKFHMRFHKYPTDRVDSVTSKNTHSIKSLDKEKPVTGENVTNSITSTIETLNNSLDVTETTLIADVSQECKYKTSDHNDRVTSKSSHSTSTLDSEKHVSDEKVAIGTEVCIDSKPNSLDASETNLAAKTNQKMIDKREQDALQVVNKKKPLNVAHHLILKRRNMLYSYCETCKCFVTKYRKAVHVQGRCKKLAKLASTCEHCGLILNDTSIVTHRRLHEERKDLKLKNFRFFNLHTGRSINPPIPEYPKCTHCAVHFLNKTAMKYHFCTKEAFQTCHLCEIKLSEAAFKLHLMFHQYPSDRLKRVNLYSQSTKTLDVEKRLTDENVTNTENEIALTNTSLEVAKTRPTAIKTYMNTSRKHKAHDEKKVDAFQAVNKEKLENVVDHWALKGRTVTYTFCETCKCFMTGLRKDVHLQGRCLNMGKIACTCEHCGLIFNTWSIVTHRRLHEERKDLQLKNFGFFNLYTGRPMNPPIPKHPKCTHCAVHFLTRAAKNNHVCSEEAYQTCNVCEIKLSEAASKVHFAFHEYASDSKKIVVSACQSNWKLETSLDVVKRFFEENITNVTENENELTNYQLESQNATKRINNVTINNPQAAVTIDVEKRVTNEDLSKTKQFENSAVRNPRDEAEALEKYSLETLEIVYSCGNCSVTVDTYDKAVEHSQGHYENEDQDIQTKFCNYCELMVDAACYTNHRHLHETGKKFKLLKFDSYYLPADNNMWIKHIFQSLPDEKVLEILRTSIYRFECRMKIDVIQQGDPNLTVYRCDQCSCFIEPSSLFKHSDNSCFKLRHHPCSVCGIPFNSSASRIDHEKIHNRPGITTDSYRIVVFNRERDKQINRSFCLRKNYVLYQCRNCGVIIEKPQGDIHICDVSNVKKCPQCALLLHSKDFEKHVNTHKEFVSFNYSNMKIIILGEDNSLKYGNENTMKSNFKGAIYDYKIYVCNKCKICVKNEMFTSNHVCRYGKQRLKCLKCDLFFSVGRLKTHTRCHEHDPDFVRSNMNIIWFDPCTLDQNKNTTVRGKDCELSDSNTDSDTEILAANDTSITNVVETNRMTPENIEEKTVKLYKCICELHFLNEDSIIRHLGVCRSNASILKQKCPKCDLLFTTNVLFTHLLAHHSKKSCYKYDVIEMEHTRNKMIQ